MDSTLSYGENFKNVKQYVQNEADENLDGTMQDFEREEELKNFQEKLRTEVNNDTGYNLSNEEFEELLGKCEVLFSPPVRVIVPKYRGYCRVAKTKKALRTEYGRIGILGVISLQSWL